MNFNPSTWFKRSKKTNWKTIASSGIKSNNITPEKLLSTVRDWNDHPPTREDAIRSIAEFSKMIRSYSAGAFDDYNSDFPQTLGSANSEIFPNLYTVRSRTRTLDKDTPQGRAIQRTYQNNVIGDKLFKLDMRVGKYVNKPNEQTGKTERVFTEEEETNVAIETFWKWFVRQENFTIRKTMSGMESGRMVEASLIGVGSVICRLHRDYPENEIKFAVDFLESDRLQEMYQGFSGKDGKFGEGNPIRGSIEYNKKWGFPVAYWLLVRHPGDSLFGNNTFPLGKTPDMPVNFREQVPAGDVIHINNLRNRPEADIGMTEMDAAVQPIWRNSQFNKAHVLCAVASHIRAFVLEKKLPTGIDIPHEMQEEIRNFMLNYGTDGQYGNGAGGPNGSNPVQNQQGSGTPIDSLRPGQERTLPYGTEAKMLAPPFPTEQAHEFRLDNHREVAIATGVSYQHASGDYQNLGFIAGLMCQIPFQDWCKIRQTHLVECWIARLFREALRAAIMNGWFDRRGYKNVNMSRLEEFCDAANFKGKRWAFVNPLVQAQTLILLMEAQIMSPQQVQDELPDGLAIEDLYAMISDAKAEAEKHGIAQDDADVTRPTIANGEPGQLDQAPDDSDLGDNGKSKPPSKSKVSNPVRRQTKPIISLDALLGMSMNGEH